VSDGRAIGVDFEACNPDVDPLAIAHNYFFGAEYDAIAKAPAEWRNDTFLRYWVAKEAVLKGEGIGLGFPLDKFRVDFTPDATTATVASFDTERLASDWRVQMVPCDDGWFGAVAARGMHWAVV